MTCMITRYMDNIVYVILIVIAVIVSIPALTIYLSRPRVAHCTGAPEVAALPAAEPTAAPSAGRGSSPSHLPPAQLLPQGKPPCLTRLV